MRDCGKISKKGSQVYLEGKQQTRKWTDKEGIDWYSTETVLNGFNATLQMLDRKEGSFQQANDPSDYGGGTAADYKRAKDGDLPMGGADDEVPR